jgi:hypothetical protein
VSPLELIPIGYLRERGEAKVRSGLAVALQVQFPFSEVSGRLESGISDREIESIQTPEVMASIGVELSHYGFIARCSRPWHSVAERCARRNSTREF